MSNSERQARYRNRLKEAALANSGGATFVDPGAAFVGTLADAPPKSLMLPLSEYAVTFLVCGNADLKMAFSLGPDFTYHAFECGENEHHRGLIIPGVRLRADILTAFDPNEGGAAMGALCRKPDTVFFNGIVKSHGFDQRQQIGWDTPPQLSNEVVGYYRWQIVLDVDDAPVMLHQIDVSSDA